MHKSVCENCKHYCISRQLVGQSAIVLHVFNIRIAELQILLHFEAFGAAKYNSVEDFHMELQTLLHFRVPAVEKCNSVASFTSPTRHNCKPYCIFGRQVSKCVIGLLFSKLYF